MNKNCKNTVCSCNVCLRSVWFCVYIEYIYNEIRKLESCDWALLINITCISEIGKNMWLWIRLYDLSACVSIALVCKYLLFEGMAFSEIDAHSH